MTQQYENESIYSTIEVLHGMLEKLQLESLNASSTRSLPRRDIQNQFLHEEQRQQDTFNCSRHGDGLVFGDQIFLSSNQCI
mmetsp:Transcript_8855/g.15072  ORF Transcript_8855/g.15072 Transcript_8855/m.15072 type:complete len:81 (-) Transcript_8855:758-1000(-)